jgi:ribose 5-phosphate isomerase A
MGMNPKISRDPEQNIVNQNELKRQAAEAALKFVDDDMVVGVGTGSTVNFFIDELATIKHRIDGAVASSVATEERLKAHHIPVLALNSVGELPLCQ